jgi:N6-L-threonylcarbamoyladenine synthase
MIIGIESTAHTFGIGIVNKGKVLCNVREMYTTESGGIIPMESAKHHAEIAEDVWKKALSEAKIEEKDITAIAFSKSPGLAPCLIEGMKFSKKKAQELNIPLIPVNHCVAHLEIGGITGAKDPVLLYASGANTQIIAYEAGKYRVFGETLDIGIGNFIDNFARHLGIGFPGGPKVQELAEKSNEKNYIELPYKLKGMDVAFSGILTKLKQMKESGKYSDEDLCFSLQETVFAMLIEASERALAHTGKKELLLGGGVGCNSRLQEMCEIMCKERGCKFFVPERPLLVDNGAMIGYLGEIMFNKGIKIEGREIDKIDIDPRERTDDIEVTWR